MLQFLLRLAAAVFVWFMLPQATTGTEAFAQTTERTALRAPIGSLRSMPNPEVYRRENGLVYLKLNAEFQVKVFYDPAKGAWVGNGSAEKLDPAEMVEVVRK